ncbi:MAG: hypothetical protein J4224_05590 [Candidatus Diapherotrites archaeon]|uniref:Uncharacterized protein n=1 Tax=Candidatus Iainarchaeum sp. TaxID=3101447 RepID=A0A7J4ISU7_9ARCH|nr:MAG: hypothetical protein QT03_C0001G0272 [archaeon GW2011_AR10]MBS3059863.1 hypothetical protein [Candidatus Diapherotrites archaeon]HIH08542.1 hypothetical protein [Candidatus Diapherotrites archaeon]
MAKSHPKKGSEKMNCCNGKNEHDHDNSEIKENSGTNWLPIAALFLIIIVVAGILLTSLK